jgi:3-isopropylmalate/(R)-2-methylmalate dehydratase large subunit
LHVIARFGAGGATYKSVELDGPAIRSLAMDARMTVANMGIEMGAKAWLMPADATVSAYLGAHARFPSHPAAPDPNADYESVHEVHIEALEPQVAVPHQVDTAVPVTDVAGQPIQQVVIGTCTNARPDDFRIAARILRGRRVHQDVRLFVIPASRRVLDVAVQEGLLQTFLDAGAVVGTPGCSGCVGGAHFAVPADGVHMVTTANRNFKGRTGNPNAFIYLASPATAAASAVEGKLADPRPYFQ